MAHALIDPVSDLLEQRKCGMPLVQMQGEMLDAQLFQYLRAANPQDYFLSQALLQIPDIQSRRDPAVPGIVCFNVRVHQIKGHAPYAHQPHRYMNARLDQRYFYN